MSVTQSEIPVTRPSAPPPYVDPWRAVRPVDAADVVGLPLEYDASYADAAFFTVAVRVSQQPVRGPLAIGQDEDGQYIVQDVLGAGYGVGATVDEAVADFETALEDQLSLLRENRDHLDTHLLTRLAALERLFPGR